MDLKNILKLNKGSLNIGKFGKKAGLFWLNHQSLFFIVFVFLAAVAGGYCWYKFQYLSGWSEEKKQEYAATQGREVNLKEEEFKKVLNELSSRKKIFESQHQEVRDIFKSY